MSEPGATPASIADPACIVIRGVNWLGDAVMTTPALRRIRERFPAAHIALFTPEKLGDLWLNHPALDEVIRFGADEGMWARARRLREVKADLALVLPNSPRSAMEMWLAKIPLRVGYQRRWGDWFLTRRVAPRPDRVVMRKKSRSEVQAAAEAKSPRASFPDTAHQVYEYLHLAGAIGASAEPVAPVLSVSAEEVRAAARKFKLTSDPPGARPLFGLNPGAEYGPAKRWPADSFFRAAFEVSSRVDGFWLLFGGKQNDRAVEAVRGRLAHACVPHLDVSGKTSLRELCALLRLCRVVLTNDSGPMHVAAALGTPVVVPFGSTSPELTGPGFKSRTRCFLLSGQAGCAPCFRRRCPIDLRCLTSITPETVAKAVLAAASADPD